MNETTKRLARRYLQTNEHVHAGSDGSYMSVGNLAAIRKKVTDLAMMIHNDTPLEDWVESKIQSASDDISDIYDYLMYTKR